MKKLIAIVVVLAAVGVGAGAYYRSRQAPEPKVTTMPVTRGDVVDAVAATGTLQAVETVDVGTQVSGTVQELYTDFNQIVHKGQVIARLDPSLIQTQIEQQEANVTRSDADLERLRVGLADAKQKYDRAKAMFDKSLIPRTDLETAEVNVKSADAQIKSAEAALVQAKASLNNQKVNLDHTIITAPIDGIVISRNVDQGQTVAASMAGPMTVKQSADTLTIERTMGDNKVTQTYKLDGSESKNAGRGGDVVSTAKWDGSKLVITTKTDNGDQVQTWSMEGGNLTIERTGGRGAGKMTYKKST